MLRNKYCSYKSKKYTICNGRGRLQQNKYIDNYSKQVGHRLSMIPPLKTYKAYSKWVTSNICDRRGGGALELKISIRSKSAISNTLCRFSITSPLKMYSEYAQLMFSHILKLVRKWSLTDHILSSVASSMYVLNRHMQICTTTDAIAYHGYKPYKWEYFHAFS